MLFSYENLYRQYLKCRRNKRNTANALAFEVRQEENLLDLKTALENRSPPDQEEEKSHEISQDTRTG